MKPDQEERRKTCRSPRIVLGYFRSPILKADTPCMESAISSRSPIADRGPTATHPGTTHIIH